MAFEIKVPSVGESIREGILARWLKKDGETVRANEPVFELETEKASQEVAAEVGGRLSIRVPEGTTVTIGQTVGAIDERAPVPAGMGGAPGDESAKPLERGSQEPAPATQPEAPAPATPNLGPPSPAVRRIAEEHGIDPGQVRGSGKDGRVTKGDMLARLNAPAAHTEEASAPAPTPAPTPAAAPAPAASPSGPRERRQRMSTIRQKIAERLVAAQQTAAILTTFNEADLSAVMALRAKYKEPFTKKHGLPLGFMSFFVKAAVDALKAYPAVNARIEGAEIVYQNFFDIGVAVSTEKGLMVPVVRDADRLSFAQVEAAIAQYAKKAREGSIAISDLQGGSFTITNGGVFGSLLSTPILNPPQSGILGMHSIQKRPVVVADQIVIRPMMYLALSYDHRIVDGREAIGFLVRIKECIEDPERLLLEI